MITGEGILSEKVSVSDMKNLKSFSLSTDRKYSLLDRNKLQERIQIKLSRKQKTFSQFFSSLLKSGLNMQYFQKKMTLIADLFLKLRTPKAVVRSMPKMSRFRGSVEKQHGKCPRTLFKIEGHLL